MDNFDLRKFFKKQYLAEGRLLKEEIKFIDYVTVDQDEFKAQYDKHYDDYGNDKDFVEEYGLDFLSPNMEKINKYYGAKVLEKDVRDDFFIGDGLEFISSNEKFEKWLDRNKQFYLAEGRLFEEDIASKAISILKKYRNEIGEVGKYIEYLNNIPSNDDVHSAIQAIADDLDRDNYIEDDLRVELEKLSLAEGKLNESINLSDYNEDVEKAIEVGIRVGSNFDEEDVMYYVHNNWMAGNLSAEEAMKKINKYLDPR
jgi:hypothetical protein